jgi:transposase
MTIAADLPDDIEELKRLLLADRAELAAAKAGLLSKTLEAEKLRVQIARLKRLSFGASSERVSRELEQLELKLEELEASEAEAEAALETPAAEEPAQEEAPAKKPRRKLPDHLPRVTQVHEPACSCPACGGAMRKVGEDVTEILDYVPGRFEVIRHVRPAYSCRKCEAMAQAPMPALPIPRGQAGPDREVLRSSAALPAVGDLCPRRRRTRPRNTGRLGWQNGMAGTAFGGKNRAARHGRQRASRRRYARAGARPRPWQDQDRPVLGLLTRRAAPCGFRAASRTLSLHPGPQG